MVVRSNLPICSGVFAWAGRCGHACCNGSLRGHTCHATVVVDKVLLKLSECPGVHQCCAAGGNQPLREEFLPRHFKIAHTA